MVTAALKRSLAKLVERHHLAHPVDDLLGILGGVAAAPPSCDGDGWIAMLTPRRTERLVHELQQALGDVRRTWEARRLEGDEPAAAKLQKLRAVLQRQHLGGFIVPHADVHQSEYIPASGERLAWLTGFTGSAGMAVVLAHKAAMFIDGRYTTQVQRELDPGLFEFRHIIDEPLADWLVERLPAGARLGYDPWLHTPAQVARLTRACDGLDARLVPVARNPVDAIWRTRPPAPLSPLVHHGEAFAGMSSARKRQGIAERLRARHEDAVVITAPDSVAWLFNVRGGDVPCAPLSLAFAILHSDGRADLFIDPRKVTASARGHLGEAVSVHPERELFPVLDALGAKRLCVRIDPEGVAEAIATRLRKAGARLREGADPCQVPKATKNAVELAGIRSAHERDGAALSTFLAWLADAGRNGSVTELSAVARLAAFRERGEHYRGPSFPTIAAAGDHGAIVHYRPIAASDRHLAPGSLFLLDSGGQYLDGTTDVTRTVAIGTPTDEMRQRFTAVLKGHIALAGVRFPRGTTGPQLDTVARLALWRSGVDYDHGTGHGVGCYLSVHEGPQRIAKFGERVPLEAGMVLSNEPGFYKPGAYGIRIENLVAVASRGVPAGGEKETLGFETLTLAPIDLALVDPTQMTLEETAWLDTYHGRVFATLAPRVDPVTRGWLAYATRPIGRN